MSNFIRGVAALLTVLLALPAAAAELRPASHGDFGHYTFALTWQPGMCNTEEGCLANQPHAPLIGLHGLWASRPQPLIHHNVPNRIWWSRGCSYYGGTAPALHLDPTLKAKIDAVMPHVAHSLLIHEFDKHVACFGFDPNAFFSTELRMRDDVAQSGFGKYLLAHAGAHVEKAAVVKQFADAFKTDQKTSLQLRCGKDAEGHEVLTQFWITIKASRLVSFPQSGSLMNALTDQTTCRSTFLIPDWKAP